jgi:hypothetical protein
MVDTSTSPFRTATPKSATNPTAAEMLNGIPLNQRARTPPTAAKGTPVNTVAASMTFRSDR